MQIWFSDLQSVFLWSVAPHFPQRFSLEQCLATCPRTWHFIHLATCRKSLTLSEENPMYSWFPCYNTCFRTLGAICMIQWTVSLSLGPVLNLGAMSSSSMESSSRFCYLMFSFSSFVVSELSTLYIIMRGFLFFGSSILSETSFGWSLNFCRSLRVSNSTTIECLLDSFYLYFIHLWVYFLYQFVFYIFWYLLFIVILYKENMFSIISYVMKMNLHISGIITETPHPVESLYPTYRGNLYFLKAIWSF